MTDKRPPRVNKLAQRLLGQTADLARNVAESSATPIAAQRQVTMPGQLGAFRLEAQKYQAKIDELQEQLAAALAAGGSPETSDSLMRELERVRAANSAEIEALKAALDDAASKIGKPFEAPVARIRKVPGRQRFLTVDERNALFANLDANKLVTPITVRPDADGNFELVSGHNRYDFFVERGRATIPAVLDTSSDAHADRDAFYANLLHNSLPDYSKFLGFKKLLAESPDLTVADVAAHAGVPRSTVANLMVFGDLPAEALALLDRSPDKLGRSAAAELASLSARGFAEQVIAAVEDIVSGKVTQSQGVASASRSAKTTAPMVSPSAITIRAGRSNFCKLVQAKKMLRLEFTTDADAQRAIDEISAVLQRLAESSKKESEN